MQSRASSDVIANVVLESLARAASTWDDEGDNDGSWRQGETTINHL